MALPQLITSYTCWNSSPSRSWEHANKTKPLAPVAHHSSGAAVPAAQRGVGPAARHTAVRGVTLRVRGMERGWVGWWVVERGSRRGRRHALHAGSLLKSLAGVVVVDSLSQGLVGPSSVHTSCACLHAEGCRVVASRGGAGTTRAGGGRGGPARPGWSVAAAAHFLTPRPALCASCAISGSSSMFSCERRYERTV